MKKHPLFSVIIPTHNRGHSIWKTVHDLQKQQYPYFELLIIDDGSTDNTKKVIQQFQADPRITYIYKKHSHVSDARNLGKQKAKGDIITYVDSDEIMYDNYLSTAVEYFQKFPKTTFAVSNYNRRVELYKEGRLIDFTRESSAQKIPTTLQDFFHWKVRTCGTGIFHIRDIDKRIQWDNAIVTVQDWDFIMQLGNIYPKRFLHIPYSLFEYKQKYGDDSICGNATYKDYAKDFTYAYKKHKDDVLLKGQQWYPMKVEKHIRLQKEFEQGRGVPSAFRYFPKQYKKK